MRCDSHGFQHPLLLPRHRRSLIYTEDSYVELFVSLAWPVPLENENVVASLGFTADYDLPTNASQLYEPYTVGRASRAAAARGRGFGRLAVYNAIEKYFTRPSTSADAELPSAYLEAEEAGRRGGCGARFPGCPQSPLDLVSVDLGAL
ncbi:uncharacterized protein LOC126282054 isoform X2 [Schistocerca gregaria]|uniref:uncharacterized protein LOC126282054 isoform X2 n=1 Tax=Schistocerca gregaria TaxID=7010 RepID=UPI00211EAA8F|nr:uncharacterized protein LOC126282054 isoform X2 [Schistocerca gregaria]